MDEKLENYFQDAVSCTLEDFDPDMNDEEREKFINETSEKLVEYSKYYAWERVTKNYFKYKKGKESMKKERCNKKIKREWQESVILDIGEDLRIVKRRKMDNVLKKARLPTPECFDAEKEIPKNILKLANNEDEIDGWDYMVTYNITTGSILSLVDATLQEIVDFLIQNCHSTTEMKEKVEKMSQYELTDKEIVEPIRCLLKDIVEMENEKEKDKDFLISD